MTRQILLQVRMGDARMLVDQDALMDMIQRQARRVFAVVTDGPAPDVVARELVETDKCDVLGLAICARTAMQPWPEQ